MKSSPSRRPAPRVRSEAPAAKVEPARRAPSPSPASGSPGITDKDMFMVESFVTAFCSSPLDYRDLLVDSWLDTHPDGQPLLFAAYSAIEVVERFHEASRARLARGNN